MTTDIYRRPAELLQQLIRFDTTNPPGNEVMCVTYIRDLLEEMGFACTLLARDPMRPNLIARLRGRGDAPSLLLQGHVDVVTTLHQEWQVPPFEGREADGYVWGRGALDMKGGVAMMLSAFMRARAEGLRPAGDVVMCVLSDEEAGGDYGAKWLVETHPDHFQGIKYAIGEFGAFTIHLAGKSFYPVMVSEKQLCTMRVTFRGPGGHGSVPLRGGAMSKLGRALTRLDEGRLPAHITPAARAMLEGLLAGLPPEVGGAMRGLLDEKALGPTLDAMGAQGRALQAALHNTISPTIVHGGEKVNVIPSEIVLDLDGRALPGYGPEAMVSELRELWGEDLADVEIEVVRFDQGPGELDMGLFSLLAGVLREADPDATPIPYLLSGVTDGRHFARLGIQTYGFLPMKLPAGLELLSSIHAADERVPTEAVRFGADAVYRVLERYE